MTVFITQNACAQAMAKSEGYEQAGWGPACANAHARSPELVECGSASTGQTLDMQVVRPQQFGEGAI